MADEPTRTERRVSDAFGIMFTPWAWTAGDRLRRFVGPPFKVERDVSKGVSMTEGHLGKFRVLVGLANNLAPSLEQDQEELDREGHSPAARSKEYAALVETLVCSLYSAIDGVRIAIYGAYKGVSKVQRGSNKELFENATGRKYGAVFPEPIRDALAGANATWFPALRKYRTEFIHGEVGSCHLDQGTGKIRYLHGALGTPGRALVIDDIAVELTNMYTSVFELAERVYDHLFCQLQPVTRRTMCGVYKGRMYERDVAPAPDLSLDSGVCRSMQWFDKEPGYECPLRHRCGAYTKTVGNAESVASPTA